MLIDEETKANTRRFCTKLIFLVCFITISCEEVHLKVQFSAYQTISMTDSLTVLDSSLGL